MSSATSKRREKTPVRSRKDFVPAEGRRLSPWHGPSWLVSSGRRTLFLGIALVIATLALYYPARHHPFVNYDDDDYVTDNAHVKAGLSWDTVTWAFTSSYAGNWHPLTWISHALDCQLFGMDASGHHDTSILFHALNAALLYWVLLRATGYAGRSFMVAALFALHPVNVESVVWIAERKNLLSMAFFLLALGAYAWYARKPGVNRYLVVALLFVLGLMAKPQVITLPFVLLLFDYWPLQRVCSGSAESSSSTVRAGTFRPEKLSRLILEKMPLFVLAAVSAVITLHAQRSGGGINPDLPLSLRLGNAIVSYVRYIGKALWPTQLSPVYPHPGASLKSWQVYAALLALAAITALAVAFRRHRYGLVGWLWFVGTLVPMIGLVQVGRQAMADRYAYLPFVGLFILVCWAVADWAQERHLSPVWLAAPGVAVLLALVAVSHRQIGYWNDNVSLWTYTFQTTRGNYEAEENLAEALLADGQTERAMPHFQAIAALDSNGSTAPWRERAGFAALARMQIAAYDQQHGKLTEALEQYQTVLRLQQDTISLKPRLKAKLLADMGRAYRDLGDSTQARDHLREATRLDPQKFDAWMDLGFVLQKSGDAQGAVEAYSQGLKLRSSDVGYLLLARALEQCGRKGEAQDAIQRAKLASADFAAAQRVVDGLLPHQLSF